MALHRSNTPCQRMQSGPVHVSLKTLTRKRPKDQAWAGCVSFLSTDDGAVGITTFDCRLWRDGTHIRELFYFPAIQRPSEMVICSFYVTLGVLLHPSATSDNVSYVRFEVRFSPGI